MASAPKGLSSQQSQALFDLLIHRQLYFGEFLRFNTADGIDGYGPPFDSDDDALSSAPVSQALISRFVLPLPGVKSIAPTFWDNVSRLAKQFSAANLSESYDHKGLGLRRLLAAGVAALLESPAKGSFAGFAATAPSSEYEYDITDADDLKQAWRALLHGLVYDSAVDELFETVAKTPDLSEHPAGIQAAHEFMLIKCDPDIQLMLSILTIKYRIGFALLLRRRTKCHIRSETGGKDPPACSVGVVAAVSSNW